MPTWTERAGTWTRNITGIGGELIAIQDSSKGTTLQLGNLHGDVIATADPNPATTKLLSTFRFDEFGNPEEGSAGRFGWLGRAQRRTELPSGVIQMGVRSYIPTLGRFLTPDPVRGGSANAYDYAFQDPVNLFDLMGECTDTKGHHLCNGKKERRELHRAILKAKRESAQLEGIYHFRTYCKSYACKVGATDERGDGPSFHVAFEMGEAAIHYISHHTTQITSGALGGLSYFLASRFGKGEFIQGCVKDSSDAFAESSELIASRVGIPVAAGNVVASCIGGAIGG